jgi:hypothetical protein
MTTTVETVPVEETDTEEYRVQVRTECAAGRTREYTIGIDADMVIDGEYVMHGRRVDGDAPDDPGGGGVSERAWDAAARRLRMAGYEVFGR